MATPWTTNFGHVYDLIPYARVVFDFERPFFNKDHVLVLNKWMQSNWRMSITCATMYVCCVFVGQNLMREKSPFDLRPILVAWNVMLAAFSLAGFLRVLPEFVYVLTHKGFEYSVCNNSNAYGVAGFWTWMFCLSKLPELLDTSFVVLRKRPLIFLHWFHHATVLIYAWYSYQDLASSGRWFVVLNYAVHCFMYSYYALRALRVNVPRTVAMTVTLSQIAQMLIGCVVNYRAWTLKRANRPCNVTDENIKYSFVMYLLYLILFAHFFTQAYIVKKPTQRSLQSRPVKADRTREAVGKKSNVAAVKPRLLSTRENGCTVNEAAIRYRKLECNGKE